MNFCNLSSFNDDTIYMQSYFRCAIKRLSRIIDRTKFMSMYCKATLYQFKTRQLFIFPVVSSPNIPAMYLWQNYLNKRKDVKVVLYSIENHMIKVWLYSRTICIVQTICYNLKCHSLRVDDAIKCNLSFASFFFLLCSCVNKL